MKPPAYNPDAVMPVAVPVLVPEDFDLEEQQPLTGAGGAKAKGYSAVQQDVLDISLQPLNVRLGFVRKVYAIVAAQLLVTSGFIAAFVFSPSFVGVVNRHPAFYYAALLSSIATIIALSCCSGSSSGSCASITPSTMAVSN